MLLRSSKKKRARFSIFRGKIWCFNNNVFVVVVLFFLFFFFFFLRNKLTYTHTFNYFLLPSSNTLMLLNTIVYIYIYMNIDNDDNY